MTDKKLMVYLENSQTAIPVTYKLRMLLRRAILETLAYENGDIKSPEVSMTFTDNEGIRELNRAHRDIDRATDVLSFPMFDFEDESEELEGALEILSFHWSAHRSRPRPSATALSERLLFCASTRCCIFLATITSLEKKRTWICAADRVRL